MNKIMQRVDLLVRAISWLTILLLSLLAVLKNAFGSTFGGALFSSWIGPVATAAAVGYLTNYIAVWLLFKPYQPHWGIQGVIPRERENLAFALGEQIPRHLLKPDQLAEQLGAVVREYLQDQKLLEDIRSRTNRFLSKYSSSIADFLLPYLEQSLGQIVQENLTAENLSQVYDQLLADWLSSAENSERLVAAISAELQRRSPEISVLIRENLVRISQSYIQQELPGLPSWLKADRWPQNLLERLNWDCIEEQISERLRAPETRLAVKAELTSLTLRLQAYLHSPQAAADVTGYLAARQAQVESLCRRFLVENIPVLVDQWLRKDEFWQMIETQLLPLLQEFILQRLEREKLSIVEKFNLPAKIRESVLGLEMSELHAVITRVSGEHLVAIQLLGYILGGIAGGLLILVRMTPAG